MESIEERLNKAREERIAREKARIDKLRELNLKKYNKNDSQSLSKASSTLSLAKKTLNTSIKPRNDISKNNLKYRNSDKEIKINNSANSTYKRPVAAPMAEKKPTAEKNKPTNGTQRVAKENKDTKMETKTLSLKNFEKKDFISSNKIIAKFVSKQPVNAVKNVATVTRKTLAPIKITNQFKLPENQSKMSENGPKESTRKTMLPINQPKLSEKPKLVSRKTMAPMNMSKLPEKPVECSRKSMIPLRPLSVTKNRESVFDRLYKPKMVQRTELSDTDRLQRDPIFLQKVLQQGSLIANKRHTIFGAHIAKPVTKDPIRRSISAVHLKRISKKELGNCFQKWSSIGEKLNEIDLTTTDEDDKVKQDTVASAIKSERKRVRLQTPITFTPRPEELQNRLQKWLQSRGKSIHSYQHLQCFGIHHLAEKPLKPFINPDKYDEENKKPFINPDTYDEENKENIELEHDSDNDSYSDCMNDFDVKTKWRGRVSYVSDSVCLNDSDGDTTMNSDDVDDVLLGALNDLTELLREGFDWEQCARWLRALRTRFPRAPATAAYWQARAALEEARGDLPASVQCWEQAIAAGTQHSVVDANLDQLLDKFMQLKISPNSGKRNQVDPKLVDVKNVFKSTIIRFAVQQAKLRQSNQFDYTHIMTPVRRSARLSHWVPTPKHQKTPHYQKTPKHQKTPLQICTSIKEAGLVGEKVLFVPNSTLCNTP